MTSPKLTKCYVCVNTGTVTPLLIMPTYTLHWCANCGTLRRYRDGMKQAEYMRPRREIRRVGKVARRCSYEEKRLAGAYDRGQYRKWKPKGKKKKGKT